MDKVELVRLALQELGDASAQELSTFIEKKHSVTIEPRFIPMFKASIRAKDRLEVDRQAARAVVEQSKSESPAA